MQRRVRWLAVLLVTAVVVAACGSTFGDEKTTPLSPDEAEERLAELVDDIDWSEEIITESASIELGGARWITARTSARSMPAVVSRFATSLELIATRGWSLRSCRA